MAHIFPDSSIILCSVPNALSADYNNVIAFKTETERYNYFSSKAIKILEKYLITICDSHNQIPIYRTK